MGCALLVVLAGTAGYLTAGSEARKQRPVPSQAVLASVQGIVQSISGDNIVLTTSGGPITLRLSADTPIEAMRPQNPQQLQPGDWLNAGAVPNSQTVFTLNGLVVIPRALIEAPK